MKTEETGRVTLKILEVPSSVNVNAVVKRVLSKRKKRKTNLDVGFFRMIKQRMVGLLAAELIKLVRFSPSKMFLITVGFF